MPKFSEAEKEFIKEKILCESEQLFTKYGIKKVSIDEIVRVAGIAKGSFYSFYPSKEHLYMDIIFRLQAQIWREMDEFLERNRSLAPRELVKQYFLQMLEQSQKHPIIKQTVEITDYLYRKLPKEIIDRHTKDDCHELMQLTQYGVSFNCGINIAAKVLQTIAIGFINWAQDGEDSNEVMGIILDGVLGEIVGEKND